jgi:Mce-associated membrane protein
MKSVNWSRVLVYGLLPSLVLLLAIAAGLLKWKDSSVRALDLARRESVSAAKQSTSAILTFRYDTIDHDVADTQQRLSGGFLDTYKKRTQDDLVPRTKQQQIVAIATAPAAAAETVTPDHAVVLVFVSQSFKSGDTAPTVIGSSARVTLEKIGARWLISDFDHY